MNRIDYACPIQRRRQRDRVAVWSERVMFALAIVVCGFWLVGSL